MAKRVFEIAKELNIASKAIVDKCMAEGIPPETIKNHMSAVSAGLEATIREWFSEQTSGTAIETAAKVDLDKVRAKPKRRAADEGEHDHAPPETAAATAVAEPASEPARPRPIAKPATVRARPAEAAPEVPAPRHVAPAHTEPVEAAPEEAPAPAARTQEPPAPPAKAPPTRPAPTNVPRRPTVTAPAGPRLEEVRTPVKLSGPKIVRVEAPETIDVRSRPRRPAGPGVGPRPGEFAGPETDDQSRSPRRSKSSRRTGTASTVPERRRGHAELSEFTGTSWSEQDLAEREARLARSGGFLKQRRQQLKRQQGGQGGDRQLTPAERGGRVPIQAPFTIKDLSAATGIKAADIVKKLFMQGIMATINSGIEPERAQEILIDYDIELEITSAKTAEERVSEEFGGDRTAIDERPRGPVVTILGHVDHGKTSLLDKIRNANVAAGEAGGITQKTSAFRTEITVGGEPRTIVFLDTPGHEAFTAMRSRGAQMTDVVVLVVSAPEGVMPQTVESINHAKAAEVPIVVALNKVDRPDATEPAIQKTLGDLAKNGVNPVEWGGDTEVVRVSATTGQGINDLLEILDYQAQLLDLKADFGGPARGTVIESKLEEGRGAVANLLLQDGTLSVGDFIVAGRGFGRVRDITDDRGNKLKEAMPPMPVQISGIDQVPDAGDKFYVVDSLRKAQDAAEQRRAREREAQLAQPKVTLDSLFSQMADKDVKEILIVLKADVQGSVDVLRNEIEKVSTDEVKVRVLHSAIGGINESDVLLADASRAVIVGFNVIASGKARHLAESKNIEIRTYDVIYNITDDIRKAAEGLLEPELRQEVLGHAEVRQVFRISKVGAIAGCYVTDGNVQRDALIRVTRQGVVIENDRRLDQLKRFKDDAKEVRAGMECGMKIAGYDDIKEGDVLECYKNIEVKRTL